MLINQKFLLLSLLTAFGASLGSSCFLLLFLFQRSLRQVFMMYDFSSAVLMRHISQFPWGCLIHSPSVLSAPTVVHTLAGRCPFQTCCIPMAPQMPRIHGPQGRLALLQAVQPCTFCFPGDVTVRVLVALCRRGAQMLCAGRTGAPGRSSPCQGEWQRSTFWLCSACSEGPSAALGDGWSIGGLP